jgi:hypothetical protein
VGVASSMSARALRNRDSNVAAADDEGGIACDALTIALQGDGQRGS